MKWTAWGKSTHPWGGATLGQRLGDYEAETVEDAEKIGRELAQKADSNESTRTVTFYSVERHG